MRPMFLVVVVFIAIPVLSGLSSHAFRVSAQGNATLYQAMITVDAMSFLTAGGGSFGYDNYFKWYYATWRKSPERACWQKVLFWDAGFLYEASNPPKEYPYPPYFN